MAYLSFRSNSDITTEAQKQKKNIVLGRPLNINEVDANFVAVNADLDKIMMSCGLGATKGECRPIVDIYGQDNVNVIKNTGFYAASNTTTGLPSDVRAGSAVIHVENGMQADSTKVGAIQITSDVDNLWYRVRLGSTTWDQWNKVVNFTDLEAKINQVNQSVDSLLTGKVSITGDKMTGVLMLDSKNLNLNTNQLSFVNKEAIKNTAVQSIANKNGLDFYDNLGTAPEQNRLAEISNQFEVSDSNIVNELTVGTNNPSNIGEEERAALTVGWKLAKDTEGFTRVAPFAEAPEPQLDYKEYPNQIATVQWAEEFLQGKLDYTFDTSSYVRQGGDGHYEPGQATLTDVDIQSLVVHQDIDATGEITGNYIVGDDGIASYNEVYVGLDQDKYTYRNLPANKDQYKSGVIFGIDDPNAQNASDEEDPTVMGSHQHGGLINTVDQNGNDISLVVKHWESSGLSEKESANVEKYMLGIKVGADGVVKTHAPTPAPDDVSDSIATTKWFSTSLSVLDFGEM